MPATSLMTCSATRCAFRRHLSCPEKGATSWRGFDARADSWPARPETRGGFPERWPGRHRVSNALRALSLGAEQFGLFGGLLGDALGLLVGREHE